MNLAFSLKNGFCRQVAAAALVTFALAGFAAAPAPASLAPSAFVEKVAQSGQLNREAARLALSNATSEPVRDFAQRMIYDQTKLDQQLAEVARRRNLELPTQPDARRTAMLKALAESTGAAFDEAYSKYLLEDRTALADLLLLNLLHPDTEVSVFASYNLPLLQHHRRLAAHLRKPGSG